MPQTYLDGNPDPGSRYEGDIRGWNDLERTPAHFRDKSHITPSHF